MRVFLLTLIPLVTAFAPNLNEHRVQTKLEQPNRREAFMTGTAALASGLAGVVGLPQVSKAFQQQLDDNLTNPTQLPTGGKFDLNSAYVVRTVVKKYKNLFTPLPCLYRED